MAIPEKIPVCHHVALKVCPKSDVICIEEHADNVVFFCRTCKGVQIYTRQQPRPMRHAPPVMPIRRPD
jgi:hypothetical protein